MVSLYEFAYILALGSGICFVLTIVVWFFERER